MLSIDRRHALGSIGAAVAMTLVGCGSSGDGGGVPSSARPPELALGDGTAKSVRFVTLFTPASPVSAPDLDFNPARPGELWVVLRQPPGGGPCNTPVPGAGTDVAACGALAGRVAIIRGATGDRPSVILEKDSNAWHFMRLPPAIAFGEGDTFATCGEARTGNHDDEPGDFMGPTLWSSDPKIFAVLRPGANGSHIDMLHATPFGMGIAHERDNVYWVFNGQVGALDRYDFHAPHQPGGDNHSDGEAWRWGLGQVSRVPGVPSHLVVDPESHLLYVADTGHHRVLRVDTRSGTLGEPLPTDDGQMPFITSIDRAKIDEVIPKGVLERPSGIALAGSLLFVSDNATSRIHSFDLEGHPVQSLDTGLPPGSLAGVVVGPDGRVYFGDLATGRVRRIDPL